MAAMIGKYELLMRDGVPYAIKHLVCGFTSLNLHDVLNRYCGHCHVFLDDEIAVRRPGAFS